MKELEQAIKILKKVYSRQDKINDETMKLLKYIYTLEKSIRHFKLLKRGVNMKEEIKKLFPKEFYINNKGEMVAEISLENLNKIADYITNLQEENEKNKKYSEFYKSIVDKAIEFMYKNFETWGTFELLVDNDLIALEGILKSDIDE